jgi:multidrug efflux pump subunit AcrB
MRLVETHACRLVAALLLLAGLASGCGRGQGEGTQPDTRPVVDVTVDSIRVGSIPEVLEATGRTKVLRQANVGSPSPAMQIAFGQQLQDVIGDLTNNPSPVEIKIFGSDQSQIEAQARAVAGLITPIRGVADVYDGITITGPSLAVHVDQAHAAQAGFRVSDVQSQLEDLMRGRAETSLQRGDKIIGVRTRYDDPYRNNLVTIENVQLHSPSGGLVPLTSIARLTTTKGQAEMVRENLKQMVAVTARISGRDLGSTIAEIQRTLHSKLVLPTGVSIAYGGTYQTQQESFRQLLMVFAAAVLFVFIVLLFEFESLRVPAAVFAVNLPSLFGVVLALWASGIAFNISSFVGTILVVGIVAEKTFAAVFALAPLALGLGKGAQMQQPLAIAVIGGFSVSTLLLLFALPMVFGLMHRERGTNP